MGFALADGIGHNHARREGRSQFNRRGRQDEQQPLGGYGVDAGALDNYAAASDDVGAREGESELAALEANIPGVPGEDYPIYAEVPESGFVCDGQVDGGNN